MLKSFHVLALRYYDFSERLLDSYCPRQHLHFRISVVGSIYAFHDLWNRQPTQAIRGSSDQTLGIAYLFKWQGNFIFSIGEGMPKISDLIEYIAFCRLTTFQNVSYESKKPLHSLCLLATPSILQAILAQSKTRLFPWTWDSWVTGCDVVRQGRPWVEKNIIGRIEQPCSLKKWRNFLERTFGASKAFPLNAFPKLQVQKFSIKIVYSFIGQKKWKTWKSSFWMHTKVGVDFIQMTNFFE